MRCPTVAMPKILRELVPFGIILRLMHLQCFLHQYLVSELGRPDAGTFWNNLALTRPHSAPSVLLELGFMINPYEFEWITDKEEQQKLARTLAKGIEEWFATMESSSSDR